MTSVDVIVPCYRYGHFLRECVNSILSQEGVRTRVLIIDDASPDDTAVVGQALSKEDARVTFLRHARNAGHIATYNEGLEWAAADYLLLLSADDYLLPGALRRATSLLDRYPQASFAFGQAIQWQHMAPRPVVAPEEVGLKMGAVVSGRNFIWKCQARNIVAAPTAVVRTSVQKKVGGYRENLPHTGDLEMWWRLAACGDVGILNTNQAVYRRHATNMSSGYGLLEDIDQRQAAVRSFLNDGAAPLGNVAQIERRLLHDLARDTVGVASTAFNMGELGVQYSLLQRALALDSSVKHSLPWVKLAGKCLIGRQAWLRIQGIVNGRSSPRMIAPARAGSSSSSIE